MQNIFKSGTDSPRLQPERGRKVPVLRNIDIDTKSEDGDVKAELKVMFKSIVGMLKKEKQADGR